ncbi:hypothetical protein [Thalassotalea profundi]|uniref:TM2 domain-containing protein n=1 Tax=Thalassotalea profundi TaxID=2036687 RepID=A0ABQ3IK37_9GAMM|nr:hypothetical protein [Thalassotalea profundi]GHE83113.1 hypothetical protein GCM10011501_09360 [Thalassotalea profundi]
MKKSIKAALLSALIYPGVGHFFLKKYKHCIVFLVAFTVPLFFIVSEIITKAQYIVDQINKGVIPLNVPAISQALNDSMAGNNPQELNIKIYVLIIIWLLSVIDAYRNG